MAKGIFAKKSIQALKEEASGKKGGLKRSLSALNLTSMGIGAIIGAGVFVLVGQAAAFFAGPAVVFSFIVAALICVFAALCYAEFASLIPVAGGPYSYAYATLGEFAAWTIGWGLTLEYLFSSATVSVGFSGYLNSFLADFGLYLPETIASAPFVHDVATGWSLSGSYVNLPALVIIGLIGTMIAVGIKAASRYNNFIVVIKLTVIALFIGCGIAFIQTDNWVPFIPKNTGFFGEFGFSGILRGAGVVFFSYVGFDALATLAQEAKNPQKDLPIAMVSSLAISSFIYIVMALVLTGVVSYKFLGTDAPFSVALEAFGAHFVWLRYVAKFGILAGLTSVILVMLLGQTRIFFTMARDGLLPKVFGKVHRKFQTPFVNTVILTIIGMLLAGFFPVTILAQLVSMGALLAFGIVCFGVLLLRYRQPSLHRPFKVPLFPWIPLAGMFGCLFQMLVLPAVIWAQFLVWILIGYVIYFGYGVSHSHLRKKG